jgi:hypothetical protein
LWGILLNDAGTFPAYTGFFGVVTFFAPAADVVLAPADLAI